MRSKEDGMLKVISEFYLRGKWMVLTVNQHQGQKEKKVRKEERKGRREEGRKGGHHFTQRALILNGQGKWKRQVHS